MSNPLAQFKIEKLYDLEVFGIDISFTNSSAYMLLAVGIIMFFMTLATFGRRIVPGRIQVMGETVLEMIEDMVGSTAGKKGRAFVPLLLTIFLFILTCNLIGMFPFAFTVTSHIAVTFALALSLFTIITVTGFIKHGIKYLSVLLPEGTPKILAPLMILIEFFSYMVRPISLSVRLAANMIAGHIMLKVIAGFIMMAGAFGVLPFGLLALLQGFEIFVAVLQAYVFTILTCVYINDAVNLH
jgi:F-type H+-transporting ATPase subunit a